jgi:hypothetical protein
MKKTAFLKKKAIVLDFSEFPDRESIEYLVHVSFQGKPYDCMIFQDFDTLIEYARSHESYGLTYEVVMRATTEYNCRVSFDGEIPF